MSVRSFILILAGITMLCSSATAYADTESPTGIPPLMMAPDMFVYTSEPAGAEVNYSIVAKDTSTKPPTDVPITCTIPSGSLFIVGKTAVTCNADNLDHSRTATKSFYVYVLLGDADTTPPTITPPPDQTFTVDAVPAWPDLVQATADDNFDSAPIVTYEPSSFDEGTTVVTWTATDAAGNTSTATSNVTISLASGSGDPDPVTIDLHILTSSATLYDGPITVSACPDTENSTTLTVNAACAIAQAAEAREFSIVWNWSSYGVALVNVGGEGDWNTGPWFTTFSDLTPLYVALNAHVLTPGESLLVTSGPMPLKISVSDAHPVVGETTTISVSGFDPISFGYVPVEGAAIDGTELTTDSEGSVLLVATSTDTLVISASKAGSITSATTTITATASEAPTGGGGGIVHTPFNVPNALAFLSLKQAADGSFDAPFVTDWVALAFAASDPGTAKTKLHDYLKTTSPAMASVLDYERHAMALMALSVSPYNGTSVDYISPIVAAFDGTQIGSAILENDDIFGIIPLLKAGYSVNDSIIAKPVAFIVSRQAADGSWTGGVDMTAAAIQALAPVQTLPGVPEAIAKARGYLHAQQAANGGFTNTPSTAWAMQAIGALGESDGAWAPSSYFADDFLGSEQRSDGGVDAITATAQNRIWNTAYAITGSLKRSWPSLLASFTKPSTGTSGGGASTASGAVASTTQPVATSTPVAATSTPTAEVTAFTATTTPEVPTVRGATTSQPQMRIATPEPNPISTARVATGTSLTAGSSTATSTNLALAATTDTAVPWWAILLAILILLVLSYLFRQSRRERNT